MIEYFDKIYCINLDKRADKWEYCKRLFSRYNLNVHRFSAVDGFKLPTKSLTRKISRGEQGCAMSHVAVIREFLDSDLEKILIFEDDIDFIGDFNAVFNVRMKQCPKWDMLYLGGTRMEKPDRVNEYFSKSNRTFTTSHYAINRKAAELVIAEIEKYERQVDVVLSDYHKELETIIFTPPVAWQRPSISDIHGVYVDYKWMRPE